MFQPRRKPVTYGKAGKRLPFQNLFVEALQDQSRPTSEPVQEQGRSHPPAAVRKRRPDNSSRLAEPDYNSEELEIQASRQLRCALETSLQNDDSSNSESSNLLYDSTNSSIFEVRSSDEEASSRIVRRVINKRRKLTPVRRAAQQQETDASHSSTHTAGAAFSNNDTQKKPTGRSTSDAIRAEETKQHQIVVAGPAIRNVNAANADTESMMESRVREVFRNLPPKRRVGTKKTVGRSSLDVPGERTAPTTSITSRHKEGASAESIASPSKLKLGSLALRTDEKADRSETPGLDVGNQSDLTSPPVTPRRSRQRLVDRLDSPHKSAQTSPARCSPSGARRKQNLETTAVDTLPSFQPPSPPTTTTSGLADLTRDAPSGPDEGKFIRARPTYGQQRSHLSDMVLDDLDLPTEETSIHRHGLAASQDSLHNNFNSQMEPGLQDEDDAPTAAVKSIHELRQAGVNSRFERELEALFEDLEAASTSSKGLRIQALIQFITRFGDPDFVRQFLDLGMTQRVASCLDGTADVLSAALLSLALAKLMMLGQPSSKALQHIFHALGVVSPTTLVDKRSLSRISKDRTQNLTKSLIRDIADLEARVAKDETWSLSPSTSLTPQTISLRALDLLVVRLQDMKEYGLWVPVELFRSCLGFLEDHLQQDPSSERFIGSNKVALSLLEYAVLSESLRTGKSSINAGEYEIVGKILAKILDQPGLIFKDLQFISLRLIVTLTNNRPAICDILAPTTIPRSLCAIFQDNFSSLATAADLGEDLDSARLETVIMALDSLLDIADRGPEARRALTSQSAEGNSVVKTMISVFNNRAGKAAEATTDAQSLVSVPFGHLCMLLCTMCLDTNARDSVISMLPDQSLTQLCMEAGNFLDQLQMLVQIQEQGSASVSATKAMSERFGAILTRLIQLEGAAEGVED